MLYRRFPKVPHDISILGFGCMRLPQAEGSGFAGKIDENKAIAMIHHAIDCGVNYIDTAYPYHDGESEPLVGKALAGGYREKVMLATKLPSWLIKTREDMDRYLNEQLARLATDHIDFYLVHGLNRAWWENLSSLGVLEFLDEAVADGRIRYPAFSFHDDLPVFKAIVDAYDWTFAQIQYNFMDEEYQAGMEGLRYAAARNLGIVAMEPLRGGLLSRDLPATRGILDAAPVRRTPAEWGLSWVWDHPEVTTALSGMSSMQQLEENLVYAERGRAGSFTPQDFDVIRQVKAAFEARVKIPCTGCQYCMPCKNGVDIPRCFESYNQAHMYDAKEECGGVYTWVLSGIIEGIPGYASCCLSCGECEEKCPQGLPIMVHLKEVAEYFGR